LGETNLCIGRAVKMGPLLSVTPQLLIAAPTTFNLIESRVTLWLFSAFRIPIFWCCCW